MAGDGDVGGVGGLRGAEETLAVTLVVSAPPTSARTDSLGPMTVTKAGMLPMPATGVIDMPWRCPSSDGLGRRDALDRLDYCRAVGCQAVGGPAGARRS